MLVPLREEIQLLSAAEILEPLSEEEVEDLARQNPDVRIQEGEILFTPDEVGESLYIVKEGRIRLYITSPKGEEITLAMVYEGKIFGEMALTAQQLRSVYAQAALPSLVLSLSRDALEDLILRNPRVGLRLIGRLSERVHRLENRLKDISFKQVPARLASLIVHLVEDEGVRTREGYEILTYYTHEQLAAMIGAHRVSVSRALAKLYDSRVLEQRERRIFVKDLQALRDTAQEKQRATREPQKSTIQEGQRDSGLAAPIQ